MVLRHTGRGTADPTRFLESLPKVPEPAPVAKPPVDTALLKNNEYLGYTRPGPGHQPRPDADLPRYRHLSADHLAVERERWDAAERWAVYNEELKARRMAEREAARESDRQRFADADTERRTAARADLEARLRYRFLANPAATVDDWERAKDGLIARELDAQTVAAERAHRARYRDL